MKSNFSRFAIFYIRQKNGGHKLPPSFAVFSSEKFRYFAASFATDLNGTTGSPCLPNSQTSGRAQSFQR